MSDFWSRRRARVAEAEEAEKVAAVADAEDRRHAEEAARLAEKSDDEILAEFGLPAPEDLLPGDGIVGFMRREIPEHLRRRALRTLWRSNPVLACLDGLNDYDTDFTAAATDAPGVATAFDTLRGSMKSHLDALMAEAEAKAARDDESRTDTEISETEAETPVAVAEETTVAEAETSGETETETETTTKVAVAARPASENCIQQHPDAPPPPRRMRFRFDTGRV
ncbi:DUF3306 domain-containing protein [Litorisediminicola beolgyonensis]|uniref:DUF3306 domain-containing protein n=1 Tax=Litorisediminicola beolgyonensis TaxID=1173614 RepID=A0ABW3ZJH1_9RHOB